MFRNRYYTIAFTGIIVNVLLQVILFVAVDPYLVAVLSPFYTVWIILLVVGYRKDHPRR